jgi:hypothetical protein
MKKFEGWICDTCGKKIKTSADGWVEWISYNDAKGKTCGRDLRLVHCFEASPRRGEYRCQFDQDKEFLKDDGIVGDNSLDIFLGPDGLIRFLAMIKEEEAPINEVLEMIKRLHVPGYEHARLYFDKAIAKGIFEPDMPKNYYSQSNIQATLKFASK